MRNLSATRLATRAYGLVAALGRTVKASACSLARLAKGVVMHVMSGLINS